MHSRIMTRDQFTAVRFGRRAVALTIATILFGLASTLVVADDAPAPYRGKLFFFGNVKADGSSLIESMNFDGSGLETVLSLKDENILCGRVSPDGRQLAFSVKPKGAKTDKDIRLCILSP